MKLFEIFKNKRNDSNREETYLDKNFNRFHYTDGGTPDKLRFLQGQIKHLTQFSYEVQGRNLKFENSTTVFTFRFDKEKKIIEELSYRSENQVSSATKYIDFKHGKKKEVCYYRDTDNVSKREEYEYNEKIECTSFFSHTYNDEGNELKTERIFFDNSDKTYKKEIVENSASRVELFNKEFYNPLNPPEYENLGESGFRQIVQLHDSKTVDTFDKYSNFLASRRYDKEGNLYYEIEVTYDEQFRRKTYSTYDYRSKTKCQSNYHYDANGFLVKLTDPNIVSNDILFENDKFGNILRKFTKWRKNEAEEEYKYEYDYVGNWTKRTMKYKGKVTNVTTRQFEYY